MIYTPMTKKAIRLMFDVHKDQIDKSGLPYVFHPWHVAEQMDDEASTAAALLHDTVEDGDVTLDDLRDMGISEEVVEVVALLTHDDDIPYLDYVKKLAPNPIARKVKLADLAHNQDLTRLEKADAEAKKRVEKYRKAQHYLEQFEKNNLI